LIALLPELSSPVFLVSKHHTAIGSCCLEQGLSTPLPTTLGPTKKEAEWAAV
jgi:hypothetical protein